MSGNRNPHDTRHLHMQQVRAQSLIAHALRLAKKAEDTKVKAKRGRDAWAAEVKDAEEAIERVKER